MCIRVLQSLSKMNCPKASFEGFILWCCPEGTYVERGGRLLSFTKVPRPFEPVATMTENTGGSQVGVGESDVVSTHHHFCLCVLPVVPEATENKKKEKKEKDEEKKEQSKKRRKRCQLAFEQKGSLKENKRKEK